VTGGNSNIAVSLNKHISAMHTAKFLVGVSPNGVLVYISPAYPGSTTDKEIVAATGIVEQLNIGDNLMADKGFLIDDLLPDGL
jgi:hypothetical protein